MARSSGGGDSPVASTMGGAKHGPPASHGTGPSRYGASSTTSNGDAVSTIASMDASFVEASRLSGATDPHAATKAAVATIVCAFITFFTGAAAWVR